MHAGEAEAIHLRRPRLREVGRCQTASDPRLQGDVRRAAAHRLPGVVTRRLRLRCLATEAGLGLLDFKPDGTELGFDEENETVLESASGVTVTVSGAAIGGFFVDGFTILGSTTPGAPALRVTSGAAPKILDDVITAGAAQATVEPIGALGLSVEDGAAPEVGRSRISGGSSHAPAGVGAIALRAVAAGKALNIYDNVIDAGPATGADGAIALAIEATSLDQAVINNTFRFGTSRGDGSTGVGARIAADARVDFEQNRFLGTAGTCTSPGGCKATAFMAASTATHHFTRNRVLVESLSTPDAPVTLHGLVLAASPNAEISNNQIHGGVHGVASTAVTLTGAAGTRLLFNTVLVGNAKTRSEGITLESGEATVDGNLVLVPERLVGTRETAIPIVVGCGAHLTMTRSALVDPDILATSCNNTVHARTLAELAGILQPSSSDNRIVVAPDRCTDSTTCLGLPTCGTAAGCVGDFIAGYSQVAVGITELLRDFLQRPYTQCFRASAIDVPSVPIDYYWTRRTPRASIGAHEIDGACP
jgi:hypothetical protein